MKNKWYYVGLSYCFLMATGTFLDGLRYESYPWYSVPLVGLMFLIAFWMGRQSSK